MNKNDIATKLGFALRSYEPANVYRVDYAPAKKHASKSAIINL